MTARSLCWLEGAAAALGRLSCRRLVTLGIALFALSQIGVLAAVASENHLVSQKARAFGMKELTIARGDTVQFANDDEFIHQIYVESPDFSFDSAESAPGDTISLKFTQAGTFEVRCHIHPKMLLRVTVQ